MSKSLRSEGHTALVEALIKARREKGLTQPELAQRLKCHQSLVARIETGQRRIDIVELVILARALETSVFSLLEAANAETPDGARI